MNQELIRKISSKTRILYADFYAVLDALLRVATLLSFVY